MKLELVITQCTKIFGTMHCIEYEKCKKIKCDSAVPMQIYILLWFLKYLIVLLFYLLHGVFFTRKMCEEKTKQMWHIISKAAISHIYPYEILTFYFYFSS